MRSTIKNKFPNTRIYTFFQSLKKGGLLSFLSMRYYLPNEIIFVNILYAPGTPAGNSLNQEYPL